MAEVSGALIAIVLVLCAVFVPVGFMGGLTGRLYKQFALTIAVSVIISGVVALTLTPALCAVLLKPHVPGHKKWAPFEWFNRAFDRVTGGYAGIVTLGLGVPKTMLAMFAVMVALALVLFSRTPTAFLPSEDKGYFVGFVSLPDAASLQRTDKVVQRGGGSAAERPGGRERRDARGARLHFQREPDQHRHHVHHPEALG